MHHRTDGFKTNKWPCVKVCIKKLKNNTETGEVEVGRKYHQFYSFKISRQSDDFQKVAHITLTVFSDISFFVRLDGCKKHCLHNLIGFDLENL